MSWRRLPSNRREFLQGSAVLTGAGALLASNAASASLLAASKSSVVLHDPRLRIAAKHMAEFEARGAHFIALTDDPVRQWRGSQREILAHRDTRLFGITRWPDFLIVRGLAAESRRFVRHESMESATGVMTWLIA